jgi:PHD/YefM family antitoxin component YafN of YafNO toxin-antitoxin module
MHKMRQKYLVDEKGAATAVVLDIKSYRRLMEHLEDLEDALELDEARQASRGFRDYSEIRAELKKGGRL